ncbi:MAG: DUF2478 domain-containing protein [Rhodobacteraceae bacterium]|nr:DUF2478 domain-containing protein [Paracoccaceae bacterium]
MLGYVVCEERGAADKLLADAAHRLLAAGWPLVGAVQVNSDTDVGIPCNMDLHVIASGEVIRISQNLGPLSQGCRLDPLGLEDVVGRVERALDTAAPRPRLLVVNKFGKQEIDGRGFRPVIGRALGDGMRVLTAVNPMSVEAFRGFAGELAEQVDASPEAILDWCMNGSDHA